MTDRIADIMHGTIVVTMCAAAAVAWLILAGLIVTGIGVIAVVAFVRLYLLPITVGAVIAILVAALVAD